MSGTDNSVATDDKSHTGDQEVREPGKRPESSKGAHADQNFPQIVGGDHLDEENILRTRSSAYLRLRPMASTHPGTTSPVAHEREASHSTAMEEEIKVLKEEIRKLKAAELRRSESAFTLSSLKAELEVLKNRHQHEEVVSKLSPDTVHQSSSSFDGLLKSLPKVDINDLQASFSAFLIHCKVLKINDEADLFQAALLALPRSVMTSFFSRFKEGCTFEKLKNYICGSAQVVPACHQISTYRSSIKNFFDVENAVNKIMDSAPIELRKHFVTEIVPEHVQEEIRQLVYLPWNEFERRTTHVLATANEVPRQRFYGDKNFNFQNAAYPARSNTARERGFPAKQSAEKYFCEKHRQYGLAAFTCEGPACALHALINSRQSKGSGNSQEHE